MVRPFYSTPKLSRQLHVDPQEDRQDRQEVGSNTRAIVRIVRRKRGGFRGRENSGDESTQGTGELGDRRAQGMDRRDQWQAPWI